MQPAGPPPPDAAAVSKPPRYVPPPPSRAVLRAGLIVEAAFYFAALPALAFFDLTTMLLMPAMVVCTVWSTDFDSAWKNRRDFICAVSLATSGILTAVLERRAEASTFAPAGSAGAVTASAALVASAAFLIARARRIRTLVVRRSVDVTGS